jgi:Ferredoxin subunits of nitrite reductase and ring-hydroxylating dioxygenases
MWHRVAELAELAEETGREFVVNGRIVAVFKEGETVSAMDGICPHAGGPLGEGSVQGGVVTCPWHGWQFHIATGQHCLSPQIRQTCFPVKVEDGAVYVELP